MADKKSNEPRRENGRIPTYQTAYHGAKKKDPLTNLARIIVEKFDKRRVPENTIDTIPFDQIYPDGLCRIKLEVRICQMMLNAKVWGLRQLEQIL